MLFAPEERARVKGVIINKFRGDMKILEPGLNMLEELIHVPTLGVVPWMEVDLEDEDSETERFHRTAGAGEVDVAVARLKHISNFTDFQALPLLGGVRVRYAQTARELESADIILLPGSKNTIEDLLDLRNRGMDAAIVRHARRGKMVIGVCGGYQMLGNRLRDPGHVESMVPEASGLGLLDMEVEFLADKTTVQASGRIIGGESWMPEIDGMPLDGYEIHAGKNLPGAGAVPWLLLTSRAGVDGYRNAEGNVLGSYLHGLFDDGRLWRAIVNRVRAEKGLSAQAGAALMLAQYRERELDRLAGIVRASLDMQAIYRIAKGEA